MVLGGYRVDMLWPSRRLVVEVDGLTKYGAGSLGAEKRREQALRRLGYRVERDHVGRPDQALAGDARRAAVALA